jgi:hypothetical protein
MSAPSIRPTIILENTGEQQEDTGLGSCKRLGLVRPYGSAASI